MAVPVIGLKILLAPWSGCATNSPRRSRSP